LEEPTIFLLFLSLSSRVTDGKRVVNALESRSKAWERNGKEEDSETDTGRFF
jgi:hypothetical protein